MYPEVKLLLNLQKICPSIRFFKKSKKNIKRTKTVRAQNIKKIKPAMTKNTKMIISIPMNLISDELSQGNIDARSRGSSGVISLKF